MLGLAGIGLAELDGTAGAAAAPVLACAPAPSPTTTAPPTTAPTTPAPTRSPTAAPVPPAACGPTVADTQVAMMGLVAQRLLAAEQGAQVVLRAGASTVPGSTLDPAPRSGPGLSPVTYGHRTYRTCGLVGTAFPSGPLDVSLLVA